jgi:hypothetical protein
LHLLLSGFKLYPVEPRLCLYMCPVIIIISSFGFDSVVNIIFNYFKIKRLRLLAISIFLLMIGYFFFLYSAGSYPFKRSEIKESLKFIEQNMNKNDKVYLSFMTSLPYQYYNKISFIKLDSNNIIIGNEQVDSLHFCNEMNKLRGKVWFLSTFTTDDTKTIKLIGNYFHSKGIMPIREFHKNESDVLLYDCGE